MLSERLGLQASVASLKQHDQAWMQTRWLCTSDNLRKPNAPSGGILQHERHGKNESYVKHTEGHGKNECAAVQQSNPSPNSSTPNCLKLPNQLLRCVSTLGLVHTAML